MNIFSNQRKGNKLQRQVVKAILDFFPILTFLPIKTFLPNLTSGYNFLRSLDGDKSSSGKSISALGKNILAT